MDRKRINRSRHFRSRKMDGNGTARSGVTAREIRKKKSLVFDFSIGSRGGSQLWRTNPLGFEQNISRCVSVCWLNSGFRSNWIRGCASLIFHSSSFSRSLSREEGLVPSRRLRPHAPTAHLHASFQAAAQGAEKSFSIFARWRNGLRWREFSSRWFKFRARRLFSIRQSRVILKLILFNWF